MSSVSQHAEADREDALLSPKDEGNSTDSTGGASTPTSSRSRQRLKMGQSKTLSRTQAQAASSMFATGCQPSTPSSSSSSSSSGILLSSPAVISGSPSLSSKPVTRRMFSAALYQPERRNSTSNSLSSSSVSSAKRFMSRIERPGFAEELKEKLSSNVEARTAAVAAASDNIEKAGLPSGTNTEVQAFPSRPQSRVSLIEALKKAQEESPRSVPSTPDVVADVESELKALEGPSIGKSLSELIAEEAAAEDLDHEEDPEDKNDPRSRSSSTISSPPVTDTESSLDTDESTCSEYDDRKMSDDFSESPPSFANSPLFGSPIGDSVIDPALSPKSTHFPLSSSSSSSSSSSHSSSSPVPSLGLRRLSIEKAAQRLSSSGRKSHRSRMGADADGSNLAEGYETDDSLVASRKVKKTSSTRRTKEEADIPKRSKSKRSKKEGSDTFDSEILKTMIAELSGVLSNSLEYLSFYCFMKDLNLENNVNIWKDVEQFRLIHSTLSSELIIKQAVRICNKYKDALSLNESVLRKVKRKLAHDPPFSSHESASSFLYDIQTQVVEWMASCFFMQFLDSQARGSNVSEKHLATSKMLKRQISVEVSVSPRVRRVKTSSNRKDKHKTSSVSITSLAENPVFPEHGDPFEVDDSDSHIFFSESDPSLVDSATVTKLIQRLTSDVADTDFTFTFLLTFRYFLDSGLQLLELLRSRFNSIKLKMRDSPDTKPGVMRCILRTINVIKLWREIHPRHFLDQALVEAVRDFAEKEVDPVLPSAAKNLLNLVEKLPLLPSPELFGSEFQFDEKPPKPKKLTRGCDLENLKLHDIHPLEFARQLALLDQQCFREVQNSELLRTNWARPEKAELAPNILSMINIFNSLGRWVISEIVTTHDLQKRVKVMFRMIQIGYHSLKLKNFNGVMAISSGLRNNCVTRLKSTWENLPNEAWDQWEEIDAITKIDESFVAMRRAIRDAVLPAVPYLGLFLGDLTFGDNEPNHLAMKQIQFVNFKKMRQVASIIRVVQNMQKCPYCLTELPPVQTFLKNLKSIPESEFYSNSQLCNADQPAKKKRLSMSYRPGSSLDK